MPRCKPSWLVSARFPSARSTPQLISVLDRAVQYTDGLTPLIETVLIATHAVASVQTVSTARLLTNTTGIAVAFPSFTDALLGSGEGFTAVPRRYDAQDWVNGIQEVMRVGSTELFGGFGRVESNYVDDPATRDRGRQGSPPTRSLHYSDQTTSRTRW